MKFSILVPVYNRCWAVKRCLESILNQTYRDFQVVVVDDNSNCDTKNYLKSIDADPHVLLHFNKENLGIGCVRNELLKYREGEYIIFVDSDDYIEKDLLLNLNKTLNKTEVDVIRFQNVVHDLDCDMENDSKRLSCSSTSVISGSDALLKWFIGDNIINTMPWTYCIKSTLYDDIEYPEYRYLEDFAITPYLILKAESVMAVDYVGYHYMRYNNSLTRYSDSIERLKTLKNVILLTMDYINRCSVKSEVKDIYFRDLLNRYEIRKERVKQLCKKSV